EVKDFKYVKALPVGVIDENISVTGNIVSTGGSDNFRKNTYIIQDGNSVALAFESTENLALGRFDKVHLLLDGAQIEVFEDCGVLYKVVRNVSAATILTRESDPIFSPKQVYVSELTE